MSSLLGRLCGLLVWNSLIYKVCGMRVSIPHRLCFDVAPMHDRLPFKYTAEILSLKVPRNENGICS